MTGVSVTLLSRRAERGSRSRSPALMLIGLPVCALALALAMLSSIAFGAADISAGTVVQSIVAFNPDETRIRVDAVCARPPIACNCERGDRLSHYATALIMTRRRRFNAWHS